MSAWRWPLIFAIYNSYWHYNSPLSTSRDWWTKYEENGTNWPASAPATGHFWNSNCSLDSNGECALSPRHPEICRVRECTGKHSSSLRCLGVRRLSLPRRFFRPSQRVSACVARKGEGVAVHCRTRVGASQITASNWRANTLSKLWLTYIRRRNTCPFHSNDRLFQRWEKT